MKLLVERLWDSTEIYTTLFLSTFSVTNLRAFWQFSTNSLLIRRLSTNSVFVSPTYVEFWQILSNIQLSKYVQKRLMSNLRALWHFPATRSIKCRLMGKLMKFFVTWCRGLTSIDRGCRILVTFCRIIENSTRYEFLLFILCLLSCVFIICYTLLYVLYPKRYHFLKKNFLSTVNASDSNGYRRKIFFIVESCLLFF